MPPTPSTAAQLHCTSYGVPFRLEADDPALLDAMRELIPYQTDVLDAPSREADTFSLTSHDGLRLSVNNVVTFEHPTLAPVLEALGTALIVHVADHAPDRVFVHAGVVGWQGCAIVLPGRSFAGKTTLVAALVKAGATYYSDEYAVLDAAGLVHPYARDLQMRQPGRPEQRGVPVESFAGSAGTEPLPVAQVVFAQFEPGAQWNPEPVSPGLAVLEMLRHTIPIQRTPQRVMQTLSLMMTHAQAWRSNRGEASAAAAAILSKMANLP